MIEIVRPILNRNLVCSPHFKNLFQFYPHLFAYGGFESDLFLLFVTLLYCHLPVVCVLCLYISFCILFSLKRLATTHISNIERDVGISKSGTLETLHALY